LHDLGPSVKVLLYPRASSGPECCRADEGLRKIQNDGIGAVFGRCASKLFRTVGGPTRHSVWI